MKKIIIATLAVAMLIASVFAVSTFAAAIDGTNLSYTLDADGTLTVTGNGTMKLYSSAGSVPWNDQRDSITKVIISKGVTSIGGYSFNQCVNLKEVYVADTVKTLDGGNIFYNCHQIDILELPSGINSKDTKAAREGNFACIDGNIVFYSDTDSATITRLTLACLLNAKTVSGNAPTNTLSFRTASGQIDLNLEDSTSLESAGADVTGSILVTKTGTAYKYTLSVDGLTSSSVADYSLNYEKGLDPELVVVEGANTYSYDSETGIVMGEAPLGDITVSVKEDEPELPTFATYYPNINENINMYYLVNIPEGYTNAKMTFTFRDTVTEVTEYTDKNGRAAFKFADIMPEFMGDNIAVKFTAELDGEEVSIEAPNTSVKGYFESALELFADEPETVALIEAMIAYGEAAQLYTGYNVDNLISSGFDIEAPTAVPASSDLNITGEATSDAQFVGVGLRCIDSMAVYYTFTAENTEGLTLSVSINGRETEYNVSDLEAKGGKYRVDFEGVMAHEFGDKITATFKKNGVAIGQTIEYSVNSYVHYTVNNSSDAKLLAMVKAIYAYGVAADNYAG